MVDAKFLTVDQELAALPDHAARARWLIRQSDSVIGAYCGSIRRAMEAAGFAEAVDFLKARNQALLTERLDDGLLPQTVGQRMWHARGVMLDAAKNQQGAKPCSGN